MKRPGRKATPETAKRVAAAAGYGHFWDERARSIIKAMRNPTPEMLSVKHLSGTTDRGAAIYLEPNDLNKIWQAMIDESLK